MTVSIVGLVLQVRRFAEEGLHVPVNKRWPLAELMAACREYATGRRVTFEWALIAGKNDDEATAHRLGELLRGLRRPT